MLLTQVTRDSKDVLDLIVFFGDEIGQILMEHNYEIYLELNSLQIMYICSIRIWPNLYLKKEHASFDARSMHVCAIVPPPCPGPPFRDSLALAF